MTDLIVVWWIFSALAFVSGILPGIGPVLLRKLNGFVSLFIYLHDPLMSHLDYTQVTCVQHRKTPSKNKRLHQQWFRCVVVKGCTVVQSISIFKRWLCAKKKKPNESTGTISWGWNNWIVETFKVGWILLQALKRNKFCKLFLENFLLYSCLEVLHCNIQQWICDILNMVNGKNKVSILQYRIFLNSCCLRL